MIIDEIVKYLDEKHINSSFWLEDMSFSKEHIEDILEKKQNLTIEEYIKICVLLNLSYDYFYKEYSITGGMGMDEELKRLVARADNGDVEAMGMVGDCYNRGFHTSKDETKAHIYYKMAADNGHIRAALMVAIDYLNGIGVKKNKANAVKYMQFAANKGLADAQYMLGALYEIGKIGFFFKESKAVYYYEMAAKQGHAQAQIALGNMNIINDGAQYSLETALFWLVCAYLHADLAKEESSKAREAINSLLQSGLPGGRERIDKIIANVKTNYSSYIKNPK